MNDLDKVTFPVLVIADDGWVELFPNSDGLLKWNYFAINKYNKKNVLLFDSSEKLWELIEIKPAKPLSMIRLLLANTIYNPRVEASLHLKEIQREIIDKITTAIKKAIDIDDDILTQWSEADDIKEAIENKLTFNNIVSALKEKRAI